MIVSESLVGVARVYLANDLVSHSESMTWLPIDSEAGVLFALTGICALFFWLEKTTKWVLFRYVPPLIFIYLVPVILSNTGVLPTSSSVYDAIKRLVLPMMLVLLMLKANPGSAIRAMSRSVWLMLFGTVGVMLGAPVGLLLVKQWLEPEAWRAFGMLAGSWIGGTGNMGAIEEAIGADGTQAGLAVFADSTICLIWLPILLVSRRYAGRFAAFTGADGSQLAAMKAVVAEKNETSRNPSVQDYLYLMAIALFTSWVADGLSTWLPVAPPYLTQYAWRVLLITTIGIGFSFTALQRIPGSHELGMALVYLFVARMGAEANLSEVVDQAIPFLLGAAVWIFIHGAFCVLGAKLLKADVHSAAIASAANIGGAASATVVATHHDKSLVPAAILLALLGYAIGNYAAYLTAVLCRMVP